MDNFTVQNFGGENTQLLPRSVACSQALEPARIMTFQIKQNKQTARARLPASITHPGEAGAGNSHNAARITHALHECCGADVSARNVALEHAVVTGGGGCLRRKCGLNIRGGSGYTASRNCSACGLELASRNKMRATSSAPVIIIDSVNVATSHRPLPGVPNTHSVTWENSPDGSNACL